MTTLGRRIAVVGSSGSGKTWVSTRLAAALGLPHVEFDAINHRPNWVPASEQEMRHELDRVCPVDGAWVADGNYEAKGGDRVRERAETVIWIDLSRRAVMSQLIRRTARRAVLRERLWNGNREWLRDVLSVDPERSVILWTWTRYAPLRAQYSAQADHRWIRLTSRAEVTRLVEAAVSGAKGEPGETSAGA